jgi:predicted DNA-binding protein (MmcQ/YjbR family)
MSVTADQVWALVARLPQTEEGAHHGHPDFRVQKKIFATLSEMEDRAALRLTQP